MFLTHWIQRSYIIYAVITLALLPSVQLLESRKHSPVRRNYRHNCDVQYINVPFYSEAKCLGTDGIRYSCKKESCNKDFQFGYCQYLDSPNTSLKGDAGPKAPYYYSTGPNYIQVRVGNDIFGCPYVPKNSQRQSCNSCVEEK